MKEIGGFFELELSKGKEYHTNAIRLNIARRAFEYIIRVKKFEKIYLPYFVCDTLLDPLLKLNVNFEFYFLDANLNPKFNFSDLNKRSAFLFINYFGLKNLEVRKLSLFCKNLIVDNVQAFFCKPIPNIPTFYSARKFFGVPDGAYLYINEFLNEDFNVCISYHRCGHLLGRIDLGAEKLYTEFLSNEKILNEQPIMKMSKLSQKILSSINYKAVARRRYSNFNFLHELLGKYNLLKIQLNKEDVPFAYPLLIESGKRLKDKLNGKKIFIPTFWQNVLKYVDKVSYEHFLTLNLLPIPIDQRYSNAEMKYIAQNISRYLNG